MQENINSNLSSNSPKFLNIISKHNIKGKKINLPNDFLFNIFILQSMYSRKDIFIDINKSINSKKNYVFEKLTNYNLARKLLDNNINLDKNILLKIMNFICNKLELKDYRVKNIQVETFYKSNNKFWVFADYKNIDKLMDDYLSNLNNMDVNDFIPFIYPQLILIHPFNNGNGRLARFLQIYFSLKYYQQTNELYPLSIYFRHVRKNREYEHKTIKFYCKNGNDLSIYKWFEKFVKYSQLQLGFIVNEINKHHNLLVGEYGEEANEILFNLCIDNKDQRFNFDLLNKLVLKHYYIKIDNQYLNIFICTLLSVLRNERTDFNF